MTGRDFDLGVITACTMGHRLKRFIYYITVVLIPALLLASYVEPSRSAPLQGAGEPLRMEEKGREIYGQVCIQCHDLNRAVIQRKTAESWRRTIYSMISRGALLIPDEIEPLATYLTAAYGPDSPPPGSDGERTGMLPDEPGRAVLVGSCGQCHGLEMVISSAKSQTEWKTTIERMVRHGAKLAAGEQEKLVQYATAHFGTR